MKLILAVIIIAMLCTVVGCGGETAQNTYTMTFKCDVCGKDIIEENVPSGYGREYVEVDGVWLMLCGKCLGRIRGIQFKEQVEAKEEFLRKLREEL